MLDNISFDTQIIIKWELKSLKIIYEDNKISTDFIQAFKEHIVKIKSDCAVTHKTNFYVEQFL